MNKLKVITLSLLKSKTAWKLLATLAVSTGLLTATDLVSLADVLKVVTDALSMVS